MPALKYKSTHRIDFVFFFTLWNNWYLKKIHTWIAASLMNCFERSFHIAGTVKTNLMAFELGKKPRSLIVFIQWSFKYLMERENIFMAGTGFPDISSMLDFLFIFLKYKIKCSYIISKLSNAEKAPKNLYLCPCVWVSSMITFECSSILNLWKK